MEGFWVEADFFPCPLLMGGCKKPSSCAFLLTAFQGMKLKLLRQGCQACPSWLLSPFPSLRPPAVCWEVLWAHSGLLAVGGQSVLQLWVSPRRHEVVALASGAIQAALNSLPLCISPLKRDDMEAIPGYLSLHQTADIMALKWTPNQLMNGSVGDLDYEKR